MDAATRERTTRLSTGLTAGDVSAGRELLPLVYDELRAIARKLLAAQRPRCLPR